MTWKFLIWNNTIDIFVLGRIQNRSLTQRWNNYLDTTCFKTAWDNNLVSYQWYFSAFIRPTVHSLTRCQHYFLKNVWYSGHIQFADETHLTLQKSDPSDPDCPGYPTHFQPCNLPLIIISRDLLKLHIQVWLHYNILYCVTNSTKNVLIGTKTYESTGHTFINK